jgi:hypothetical protein
MNTQSGMASMLSTMLGIDIGALEALAEDMAATFKRQTAAIEAIKAQLDRVENLVVGMGLNSNGSNELDKFNIARLEYRPEGGRSLANHPDAVAGIDSHGDCRAAPGG